MVKRPSEAQRRYLVMGLRRPGGKLPLFDGDGQRISPATVRSCLKEGWAARRFNGPEHPDWMTCRLTEGGRAAVSAHGEGNRRR
jgi:hypothetical protein